MPDPFWTCDHSVLYNGDALSIMRELPDGLFDAVITDPPYSSGGLFRGDRNQKTSDKYVMTGTEKKSPEFFGDTRDQRSFLVWAELWLREAWRITKPSGFVMTFTDWRQLPTLSDAIQAAGWIWRGIVVWDKTEGVRPQRGFFRAQCEYILTGSKGGIGKEQDREVEKCAAGLFRVSTRASEKMHITGKPVQLMANLLQILPAGAFILDPFAGSGSRWKNSLLI